MGAQFATLVDDILLCVYLVDVQELQTAVLSMQTSV